MKKVLKTGSITIIVAIVLNIIETIYFGCNKVAMSRPEEACDVFCALLYGLGLTLMLVGSFNKEK